ncbi:MAG: zinc-binding dehydrogenase, partial [Acidimicrobiales bacterium]
VHGRLVVAGAVAGPVVDLDLRRLYLRQRRITGSTMHTRGDFVQLAQLARNSAVHPLVAAVYPLAEIHDAQQRFLRRDFMGKVVLSP